jgi:hypothetical protein
MLFLLGLVLFILALYGLVWTIKSPVNSGVAALCVTAAAVVGIVAVWLMLGRPL